MSLTNKQRKDLFTQASHLRVKVQVGQAGLTNGSVRAIDNVLEADEICKIKFLPNTAFASPEEIEALRQSLHAELVGTIGKVLILYRKNEKKGRKPTQNVQSTKKYARKTMKWDGGKH